MVNLKFLISLFSSALIIFSNVKDYGTTFNYVYQIKANSFSPKDTIDLYYYKEKLIDKYEDISFSIDSTYLLESLKVNISQFKFDEKCFPEIKNGALILTIGNGKGSLIEGKLRQNICDENVIRDKIYILEIFK